MRKLLAILALAGGLHSPVIATPPENPGKSGAPGFCANNVLPNVPEANLGECVSYVIVPPPAFPVHDCDAFMEIAPDVFFAIYDSYSDCFRTSRQD